MFRLGQSFVVELAVWFERNFIDMNVIRRNHIIRQFFQQFCAQLFRIDFDVRRVISAKIGLTSVLKALCRHPIDTERLLYRRLDFSRLNAVAVYFNHIVTSSEKHEVPVRQFFSKVAAVIDTVHKGFRRFLGEIDIAANVFVTEAKFTHFTIRHGVPVLIKQHIFKIKLRLADRAGGIRFINLENADNKAAFAHGVHIVDIHFFKINIVCGFTADNQLLQKRTGLTAQHTHIGGGQKGYADAFFKKHFLEKQRIFDRCIRSDKFLALTVVKRIKDDHD